MEYTFKKVHTGKDLTFSGITIIAGIGLFFLNGGLGGVIALIGLLMLLFYKTGYKNEGAGAMLTKKAVDIPHSDRENVIAFLEGRNDHLSLSPSDTGGIVRMEVLYNRDASLAYVQLFDYSNYTYQDATGVIELQGARADQLIGALL